MIKQKIILLIVRKINNKNYKKIYIHSYSKWNFNKKIIFLNFEKKEHLKIT